MKSRVRSAQSLARRKPARKSRDRVLIVCEGEKTEPLYLEDLIYSIGLTSADVKICGAECGSDPKSIYLYAMETFRKDGDYDVVFCVFDRDKHTTFDWACRRIKETVLPDSKKMTCIKSIPCFEYWIIIHFSDTSAPIIATGGQSSGQKAVSEVKKYLPWYGKGAPGVYAATKEKLPKALTRSRLISNEALKSGSENPMTLLHELIEHLFEMVKTEV
ncbi:RloB family protein [Lichenicoccus sp.]|uniref:RloB family protein n=1 Tax=Lichenicoccus sp. TaxID=2781899 RepID=UPI003D0BBC7B